jgi:2-polyprenyl-3-methyl-5-hydroxy-6-metoxy-1,4-benzoquinol methylase
MTSQTFARGKHEIDHGKMLAEGDPELIWGWKTPAGQLRAKRRAQLISSGADLRPGKLVLEIGCGTGMFTEMFAQSGATIMAVDISPALLDKARARGLPVNQVQFLEKSFEDCDLEGPFDAVIGSSVLHHLEIKSALDKIYSLLKPGGILSFAEPNMINPQVFLERKFSRVQTLFWYVSPDETAFVRWQLQELLLKTGFTGIDITPFDWLHPATPPALINLVSEVGSYLEMTPIVRELAGSLRIRCIRPR